MSKRAKFLRSMLFLILYLVTIFTVAWSLSSLSENWQRLLWGTISSLALFFLTKLFLKWRPLSTLPSFIQWERKSFGTFLIGNAFGFSVCGFTLLLVHLVISPLSFSWAEEQNVLLLFLLPATYVVLSSMEELGTRGYALHSLSQSIGTWPSQILIAILFGLSHVFYGWSLTQIIWGVIPSGFLFGIAAFYSRGLSLPIGIHAGLNIANWLFGEKHYGGPWRIEVQQPELAAQWVGIVNVVVIAVSSFILWMACKKYFKNPTAENTHIET